MNLLQGNLHKSNGNGTVQVDGTNSPGRERNIAIDMNQALPGELQNQNLYGEDSYSDPNTNPMTSRGPYTISPSDFKKIQVHFTLFYHII